MSSFQARGSMANMWRDPLGFPFQTEVWESQYNKSKLDSDLRWFATRDSFFTDPVKSSTEVSTGLVGGWWLVAVCSWLAWILGHWFRPVASYRWTSVPRFIVRAVATKQSLFFGTTWLQTQQSTRQLRIRFWKHAMTINDPTGVGQLFLLLLLGVTSSAWKTGRQLIKAAFTGWMCPIPQISGSRSSRGGRVPST